MTWPNSSGLRAVNGVEFPLGRNSLLEIATLINWQGFATGASRLIRFIQQSASGAVLSAA
jgi:hypothetical protein